MDSSVWDGLDRSPGTAVAAARLMSDALAAEVTAKFLASATATIRQALAADAVAIFEGEKGLWRTIAATGPIKTPPVDVLSEAVDAGAPWGNIAQWTAAPLAPVDGAPATAPRLLAVHHAAAPDAERMFPRWIRWLTESHAAVRRRLRTAAANRRLEAILQIAAAWQGHREIGALLQQMAETSTKLVDAERATIFLRDRKTKELVGRPALGVEGNEIRIPEHAGVVGQTIDSGEPRRVDADVAGDQREVHRAVDQKLKFHTRTLLCAPLRDHKGEVFGAFELINKRGGNFTADDLEALQELAKHAAAAIENTQQFEHVVESRRKIATQAAQSVEILGDCPAIGALRSTIERVADTDLAVLVLGENGTGKEVVGQMIHYRSRRRDEPLLAVNCAAIAETLLESELFGHEKGAFTDARETRAGKFELASGGTLFLDEIGDMSLGGQAKLLRVLEEKTIVRVGGSQSIAVDVRILAATNKNLAELVQAKRFREDLYYRLSVVTLELPPLRARGNDVLTLAEHFMRQFCRRAQRKPLAFSAAANKRLLGHDWPGNVRELRNLMERLAYLEADDRIDAEDIAFILSPKTAAKGSSPDMDQTLAEATRLFQIDLIERHIAKSRGNMTLAAENLGLHRSNLYRKMRQLGMEAGEE